MFTDTDRARKAAYKASVRKQARKMGYSISVVLWLQHNKKPLFRASTSAVTWSYDGIDHYMSMQDANVCVSLGGDISD